LVASIAVAVAGATALFLLPGGHRYFFQGTDLSKPEAPTNPDDVNRSVGPPSDVSGAPDVGVTRVEDANDALVAGLIVDSNYNPLSAVDVLGVALTPSGRTIDGGGVLVEQTIDFDNFRSQRLTVSDLHGRFQLRRIPSDIVGLRFIKPGFVPGALR